MRHESHISYASHGTDRNPEKEKGQVETRPGLLGESAHNKQPAAGFISWLSVVEALPSFAHKPRVPKRWPLRPRS
jgi:hypothetical protein